MQNNTVPPEIIEKIQKIMARTAEANCTPAEVEQATRMVQELLMKYNLTMSDVRGHSKKGKRQVNHSFFSLEGRQKRHDSTWVQSLVYVLAKFNLCTSLYNPRNHRMIIIGEAHNVEIIMYLTDQLIPRIESACSRTWSTYFGDEKRNTFRRGFLMGCVTGISVKLGDQQRSMEAQDNNIMALVKVNSGELNQYIAENFKTSKPNNKSGNLRKSSDSKYLGYEAGKNMQINKGLDDSAKGDSKLLS